MTSGQYTPLEQVPSYSDELPLHPQTTVTHETTVTVHDVTHRQVSAFCLLCSILNYLCCPCLGIPALIFAILGIEAEKRGELEAAKSHSFYLKVFNIIYAVKVVISLILFSFYSLSCIIGIIIVVKQASDNFPYPTEYPTYYYPNSN
ncbi:hypothetical protein LOD99_7623 [Oopsacas minuta]|uniref:Uncharacterized protein n=1 Tax=Oopsacas minuta TaxID=111878 RepID=A0AAV7JPF2_9METZ|nr:hypothetical protein LOD99_7623 [Oopsacas minuta]